MVAEHDPITAKLERYFLQSEGYDVRVVLDGRTAQEAAAMRPDSSSSTSSCPGWRLQGRRELKADPASADIPVVVFSMLYVRERRWRRGGRVPPKPLEQPALIVLVRAILARTPARGRAREASDGPYSSGMRPDEVPWVAATT